MLNLKDIEIEEAVDTTTPEIRDAAYFLWLNAGCPEGRDLEFWCEAERQITGFTMHEYWAAVFL